MPGLLSFRSFRTRLLVFLLGLLLPVLAGIYYYVNQNNRSYTDETINSYLESGAEVFDFTRQQQSQTLLSILASLTWDFGFRTAYGTRDPATLFDASLNVLDRSLGSVEMLMITDLQGQVLIDTSLQGFATLDGEWRNLLDAAAADEEGIADAIIIMQDIPYQVIAVPLYLPRQVAWIIGGYALDQTVLDTVKRSTLSEVSLVDYQDGSARVMASTLPMAEWPRLSEQIHLDMINTSEPQRLRLSEEEFGTLPRLLASDPANNRELVALIHRSYSENIENEQRFQQLLAEFYLAVLVISLIAVVLLARSITNPLTKLAFLVKKIEQGDYNITVPIKAKDELGQLADSVNSMATGLAEKEKVRDLLGKVVSRQIADELIRNPVELGGEERVVTVLFVDIKGFTAFCEGRGPQEVLHVLNRYLSHVTNIIEAHQGVVDKFNGDAVMALFGAPIAHVDDARFALEAALEIRQTLGQLAQEDSGMPVMEAGIGVHTGLVVAGNLGSSSRLNYSVIGDSVNLASRLESLTRFYGVPCIVSEATRDAAPGFVFRELDRVRVFGKQEPVRIFELVAAQADDRTMLEINEFAQFLDQYRHREWEAAEQTLQSFAGQARQHGLYRMYQDRIAAFKTNPPDSDWQGVFTFDKK